MWALDFERWLATAFQGTGLLQDHASDYALAAAIACAFPLVRWLMDRHVYDPLARQMLRMPRGDPKKTDVAVRQDQLDNLEKFKGVTCLVACLAHPTTQLLPACLPVESAYKCGVQVCFTLVLVLVSINKPWFSNTRLFWDECDRLPCNASISLGERFVYCLTLGFYAQAVPMLFLWETKRKDRLEVFAHHAATIILIACSYYLNLTRVGVMVLVCHESNDIFLEAAKMARYAKLEPLTTPLFVVFMLSWFATRVTAFPLFVIRSTLFESKARAAEVGVDISPHYQLLNGFLLFLYCLHIYWSYLILCIVVRQLRTGSLDDIREEEERIQQAAAEKDNASAGPSAARQGAAKQRTASWPDHKSIGSMPTPD